MKKNTNSTAIRAIYRKANAYPEVRTFESVEDIYELLGKKPFTQIHIRDSLYAIARPFARVENKPLNFCTTVQVGSTLYIESAYGDVVVCNYDPEQETFSSLTASQIESLMFTNRER